jgi:O-acetyl-ADP-ribose deacetylase (regulator of RNase III)
MLEFRVGNMLDAPAEALVNTVNELGVMGKGIALMFKERFPVSSKVYIEASKAGRVHVGKMLVTPTDELLPKWIIHFPTKKHWRHPSQLAWITEGLTDLERVIRDYKIRSVAIPPLGCGNGGLDWTEVRGLIEKTFEKIPDVSVLVYEPTASYQNVRKTQGVEKLTPARALIAEMVRRYSILGIDCSLLEVHKLAYFLQESIVKLGIGDPLDLRFEANKYGPYADRLRHLLDSLDGSYLHADRRISDARPLDGIWFEESRRDYVKTFLVSEAKQYLPALERTSRVIDGFESPLGLELLATVHWMLSRQKIVPAISELRSSLAAWPGGTKAAQRKLKLFDDHLLGLALERLIADGA